MHTHHLETTAAGETDHKSGARTLPRQVAPVENRWVSSEAAVTDRCLALSDCSLQAESSFLKPTNMSAGSLMLFKPNTNNYRWLHSTPLHTQKIWWLCICKHVFSLYHKPPQMPGEDQWNPPKDFTGFFSEAVKRWGLSASSVMPTIQHLAPSEKPTQEGCHQGLYATRL